MGGLKARGTPTQPPPNANETRLGEEREAARPNAKEPRLGEEREAARPNAKERYLQDGQDAGQIGLEEEIALVRLTIRQLYSLAQEQDAEQAVRTLNALSASAGRLARLVQTQASLRGGEDEISAALTAALNQVMEEFGLCP
ncbi:MAG: hypothetical protein QME21_10010 [Anaerolineales bacterium]|nr:hypothetical protein [Anaerolineales bacterium]